MPLKKDPLLEALSDLRDQLKARDKDPKGRSPKVCSDDALKEIAKRKPLKKSAFKAIQGLGDVFVERYADDFLRVIYAHKNAMISEVKQSKQSKRVLADFKDRLSNISRKNRNLYTAKIAKRYGVDLYQEPLLEQLKPFIETMPKKPLRLTHKADKELSSEEERFYRTLTMLYREVNREVKEKGAYNLHIAYPFVQGKLPGEGFEVKAPLMFFPVILERKGYDFYVYFNQDKDVRINRDLLLANNKFNHFDAIKDEPTSDMLTLKNFNKTVLPFYETNHLSIKGTLSSKEMFAPFENTTKDDFKWLRKGTLKLKPYIVLGKYSLYSSKVQEDITAILNQKTYNDLLDGLLDDPYKPYDYTKASPFKDTEPSSVHEQDIVYINDLNYSQEHVLTRLKNSDKISIWGPPGTGKSQTITSLIASQINKGENVLVVSEKKVALDVIKSRLGYAGKFSLFMDDAQDKQTFYHQLKQFIDPDPPHRTQNNDPETLDGRIEKTLGKLRDLYETFYKPTNLDVPLYSLYPRYIPSKKVKEDLFPQTVYETFKSLYRPLSFKMLSALEEKFDDAKKLRAIMTYKHARDQYPLIHHMNLSLTRSEKITRTKFFKALDAFKENDYKGFSFTKRRKRKRFIKTHYETIGFFFKKPKHTKQFIKALIEDASFETLIRKQYPTFERADYQFQNLTPSERTYINALLYQEPFQSIDQVHLRHNEIFSAVYTGFIEAFEADNKDKLYDIAHYKTHMEKLQTLIKNKQTMETESFAMKLYQDALNFSNSKRIMDIKQRIESARKISVSRFIDAFQLELFSNIKVWMMTPEVISEIIPLNYAMFDLVIFDEASQMYVEKAIPTIYRAKKAVVAGDTKQLRPSSLGQGRLEPDDEFLEDEDMPDITLDAQSLLDLARYKYDETVLNYHYRSKYEELINFSNYAFYEGKLIVSPNQEKPKKPPIEYIICDDGLWENRQNVAEAKKVIELIKKAVRGKSKDETLGVITFNTAQRNLVEDLLDEELFKNTKIASQIEKEMNRFDGGEDQSLFIKNIENVQGDERDIIIFTTAYAKNKDGRFLRQFGWLNNEGGQNRLNVAISRAKRKIYLVTSFHPHNFHVDDLKSEGPKRLRQYLEYCYHISNKDEASAARVLETLSESSMQPQERMITHFKSDVHERLNKEGWHVQKDIGIGKYTIDFAVEAPSGTSYQLGIICDVQADAHAEEARDMFYHQEKYLRARGWTLYRVFSPNWYKDANKEMREIRKILRNEA